MNESFNSQLAQYLKERDKPNATRLVFTELANTLAQDRENFKAVLLNAGVGVGEDDDDSVLIDKFVDNAPTNKRLMLGASFLINYRNQQSNADGDNEVSDAGVKNTYKIMRDYFMEVEVDDQPYEEQSNWIGAVTGLAGKLLGKKGKGDGNADAKLQMQEKIIAQKRAEALKQQRAKERAERKSKNLLIYGSIAVGVLVIGVVIYALNKKRK
jgi:hypothetical protein